MPAHPFSRFLRTKPIPPQVPVSAARVRGPFGKALRPLGDPVSPPKAHARFIPPPPTSLNNLTLPMDVVLPDEAKVVLDEQMLVFHSVGDTGGIHGEEVEKAISDAMEAQLEAAQAAQKPMPAFYYHLGDVVYFNGLSTDYDAQFYEPYQGYHGPIFAIAGNHDGDTHTRPTDPVDNEPSLYGFMRNFCDTTSIFDSAHRPTMTQPYVYWTFDTPFATIIGLYSNVDGTLDARGKNEQQSWFEEQAGAASKDKALIVAVHHPPYSLDTTHGGYPDIGIAIDRVIDATGRVPTAVLSGHVHSYQRFERTLGDAKVPYIVAGAGGYANNFKLIHKIEKDANGNDLEKGSPTTLPEVKFMAYNDQDPGFLRITIDARKKTFTGEYFLVPFAGAPPAVPYDSVEVPW